MKKLYDCKTNGLLEPIGVGTERLSFQWKLPSGLAADGSTSFRLGIASSKEKLAANQFDIWEAEGTGQMYLLPDALSPYTLYWWRVMASAPSGESAESDACSFETGAPCSGLPAAFIGGPDEFLRSHSPYREDQAKWLICDDWTRWYYRKNFDFKLGDRAFITVDYDFAFTLYVNGKQADALSGELFEVTAFCAEGINRLGILAHLSNTPLRFTPAIRVKLELRHASGEEEEILSDSSYGVFNFQNYYSDPEEPGWAVSDAYLNRHPSAAEFHPAAIRRSLLFRKDFQLPACAIRRARAYVTAKGLYELHLNGQRVGDALLTPGVVPAPCGAPHASSQVLYYQTYDLAPYLRDGENVIGAITGNGWYASQGYNTSRTAKNELCAYLRIELCNGELVELGTDSTWRVMVSPITENDLQWGERYDARLELPGWDLPEADLTVWNSAEELPAPSYPIKAQPFESIKAAEILEPVKTERRGKAVLYDFGKNISGRARLTLTGPKRGQAVSLRYGERLDQDGALIGGPYHDVFYAKDTWQGGIAGWGARNVDCYICRGDRQEEYMPRFAYTGFRYVEVEGCDDPQQATVQAVVFHTALEDAGGFICSNELLNGIYGIVKNSFEGNLHYGPTDCPTREKNFWNGDAAVFIDSALWLKEGGQFWREWTTFGRKIYSDAAAWWDEDYITPWNLYLFYGDRRALEDNYDKIKADAERRLRSCQDGVYQYPGLGFNGDHAPPLGCANMDPALFNSVFCYHHLDILSRIAGLLGHEEDRHQYAAMLPRMAQAIRDRVYLPLIEQGERLNFGTYLLPIAFGILKGQEAVAAAERLNAAVTDNGFRLNTGAVATPFLLPVLCDFGYYETAWRVAVQTEKPSWGHMLLSGSTATTELWEGEESPAEGNSQNHFFKGTIVRWLYEYLAGIRYDEAEPGFRHIQLEPVIPKALDWVRAWHETPFGRVASEWEKQGEALTWKLAIPSGSRATVTCPAGWQLADTSEKMLELSPGNYCLRLRRV